MDFNNFKIGKQANSATVELDNEVIVEDKSALLSSYKVNSGKGGNFNPDIGYRIFQSCSGNCNTTTGHFVIGNKVICTICKHEYQLK